MKTTCAWLLITASALAFGSGGDERFELGKTIEVVRAPGSEFFPMKIETGDPMTSCVFHDAEAGKFPKGIQLGQKLKVSARWYVTLDLQETSLTTKEIYYIRLGTPNGRFHAPHFYAAGLLREADTFWRKCKRLSSNPRTCAASTKDIVLKHFRVVQYSLTDEAGGSVNLTCGTSYRFNQWFPAWGYRVASLPSLERAIVQK